MDLTAERISYSTVFNSFLICFPLSGQHRTTFHCCTFSLNYLKQEVSHHYFPISFVEIDHEIFSTVILSLPLIQEGQLSVSGERMCTILVNRLED